MSAPIEPSALPRRRLPPGWPSVTQWLWLILLAVLLSPPWPTRMVTSDGDPCMHWRMGEEMLRQRALLRQDRYSHTRPNAPFLAMAWGAELIDAAAGRLRGLTGLGVVGAVVIATTFAWLYAQLLREGNHELVAIGVTLAAAWAASLHWLARPLLFTVLLAVVWHDELRRYESGGAARRVQIGLPLLMLVWTNLHAGFIFGFVLLGIYWCGATVDVVRGQGTAAARRWRTYTLAGTLCGAASLLNPQGIRLHLYVLAFVRSPYLRDWFTEYASANFQSATARPVLVWLALLFGTLVWCRQRWRFAEYAVVGLWTYAGLYAMRNVPLMAVLSAPILAGAWSAQWRAGGRARALPGAPVVGGRGSGALVGLAAILLIGWRTNPIELPRAWLPVEAVAFVRGHPDQVRGNVFNAFVWGGYLMEYLPEQRVFVDGRADFYGESLLKEFDCVTTLWPGWQEVLEKYHVTWTIMPTDHRLNVALALSGWEKLYGDATATIYRRPE